MKNAKNFWEQITDYDLQVVSVFSTPNPLIEYLLAMDEKRVVADFGCGSGNSFRFLAKHRQVYAVDYSANMLSLARENRPDNVELIQGKIKDIKLPAQADLSLAISSLFPSSITSFYSEMDNILRNSKPSAEILITLPSLESRIFSFQLDADHLFRQDVSRQEIWDKIRATEAREELNTLGYMRSNAGLIQKHWLKEEIGFRLAKYAFSSLSVEKLELDWEIQLKRPEYNTYPRLWLWLIKIKR